MNCLFPSLSSPPSFVPSPSSPLPPLPFFFFHLSLHSPSSFTSPSTPLLLLSPLPPLPLPSPSSLVGYPGAFNRIGSVRLDECPTYGCFLELTIQLVIILLGKQILNNCTELGLPIAKQVWKRFRHKKEDENAVYTRWERDFDLPDDDKFGLLPEYLELVIQYGFITIFVAAFPLAPLAALLNNWVEIRLDAYKYVVFVRRQVSERGQDIGAWYGILDIVSKLAVVTNVSGGEGRGGGGEGGGEGRGRGRGGGGEGGGEGLYPSGEIVCVCAVMYSI